VTAARCFIAAHPATDVRGIAAVLQKHGYQTVQLADVARPGAELAHAVREAIEVSDLFVAVFDDDAPTASVAFELGLAYASERRTLVIAPPAVRDLPVVAIDALTVSADPSNTDALDLALGAWLDQSTAATPPVSARVRASTPLHDRADELLERLEKAAAGGVENAREFETIVAEAFAQTGARTLAADAANARFDLAVSADELEAVVGNPVAVEAKLRLDERRASDVLAHLRVVLMDIPTVQWAVVVYLHGPPSSRFDPITRNAPVLFIEARELVERLRDSNLGQVLWEIRNRRAHAIGD
jgi:hypothetical protein